MKVRLHPQADVEIQAAAQWYEDQRPGLGEQFVAEVIDALEAIEQHPKRFSPPPYHTARKIRRCPLEHFPFAVVYEIRSKECIAVAVAHAAREPGYWRDRLN